MRTKEPGGIMRRNTAGNCGCASLLLALILLPIITANPLIGLIILFFLLSSSKQ